MSKYEGITPGKWHAVGDDDGDFCIFAGDKLICNVGEPIQEVALGHPEQLVAFDIDKANAALVADAPALAERTRRALNKLRYMSSGGSFLAPTHNDIGHLIRILEGEEDKS